MKRIRTMIIVTTLTFGFCGSVYAGWDWENCYSSKSLAKRMNNKMTQKYYICSLSISKKEACLKCRGEKKKRSKKPVSATLKTVYKRKK